MKQSLARLGGDVVGIDASESNISIANLHASRDPFLPYSSPPPEQPASSLTSGFSAPSRPPTERKGVGSLEYRHTSAEALRDAGEKFDLVCAMEVLEHVDEPGEFMKCLGDMLKVCRWLQMFAISDDQYSTSELVFILPATSPWSESATASPLSSVSSLGFASIIRSALRPLHPLHNLPNSPLPTPHPYPGRVHPPSRHTRNSHLLEIRETFRTPLLRVYRYGGL